MKLIIVLLFISFLSNVSSQEIDYDFLQDVRGENVFQFSIHPSIPILKFVLIGDSIDNSIVEIIVYKNTDTIPFQEIIIDEVIEPPVKETEYFVTCDFNFDGYKDIMLLEFWGTTGNRIYKGWLFNPGNMKFESNDFLSAVYSPEFNYDKKEFTTFDKGGFGEYYYSTYKYIRGKFILIREKSHYWDNKLECFFEDKCELKDGKMKLMSHRKVEE